MTEESRIRELTELLRTGTGTFWQRLRAEVEARGLDPTRTLVVDSLEDDYRVESGVLVTHGGRVITYDYDFYKHGDIGRGTFTKWADLTDYADTPYRAGIETALALRDA